MTAAHAATEQSDGQAKSANVDTSQSPRRQTDVTLRRLNTTKRTPEERRKGGRRESSQFESSQAKSSESKTTVSRPVSGSEQAAAATTTDLDEDRSGADQPCS